MSVLPSVLLFFRPFFHPYTCTSDSPSFFPSIVHPSTFRPSVVCPSLLPSLLSSFPLLSFFRPFLCPFFRPSVLSFCKPAPISMSALLRRNPASVNPVRGVRAYTWNETEFQCCL